MKKVKIEASWYKFLESEFDKDYFTELRMKVREDYLNLTVYPHPKNIFRSFYLTPVESVKVVILGQDPYHGEGQAHGLAFSVPDGVKTPPSLVNIYKELYSDIGIEASKCGNLSSWSRKGVLLLNTSLTVVAGQAASHSKIGWEKFTDAIILNLSLKRRGIVFLLWGNHAKSKAGLIDPKRHCILSCAHPSPLSAHNGFFGSAPFSKANTYLSSINKEVIDWSI